MLDNLFGSIINNSAVDTARVDITTFLICIATALVVGIIVAFTYTLKNTEYSRNFIVTLAVMPVVVSVVILLVNSLTTGIAIAGIFNLVRFRSIPGTSREIANIFMATVVGVAIGTVYIAYGLLFVLVIIAVNFIFSFTKIGTPKKNLEKELRITVPESLDFEGIFDDIFDKYTTYHDVEKIKTSSMGTLYQISYRIKLKPGVSEKEMIDEIRCRNGNLDIVSSRVSFDAATML
jgi:hypothetical protein